MDGLEKTRKPTNESVVCVCIYTKLRQIIDIIAMENAWKHSIEKFIDDRHSIISNSKMESFTTKN